MRRQLRVRSQPQSPGHTDGLINLGNTCFLNSAFQALRLTPPFREFLASWRTRLHALDPLPSRSDSATPRGRAIIAAHLGTALVEQTAQLATALDAKGAADPRPFVRAFFDYTGFTSTSGEFQFRQMGDASEALHAIMDGLHMNICRTVVIEARGIAQTPAEVELMESYKSWARFFTKEYSLFISSYYGQTQMRSICKCGETKTVYEPWSSLKISIPGGETAGAPVPSFRACVNTAFMPEVLDDYRCDVCKEVGQTTKYYSISRFPDVLILVFKRFTDRLSKIQARIAYDPDWVDLEEWGTWAGPGSSAEAAEAAAGPQRPPCPAGSEQIAEEQGAGVYKVASTIEQTGTMQGGHYLMRHRTGDDGWVVYDDDSVSEDVGRGAPTPDTYVLVLERLESRE